MIYQDYMRRKMHNVVKLDTAEGYPLTVYNCANKNLKDYTIYGNTVYSENVFNYTEPYDDNQIIADENGWFDVTIDNSRGGADKIAPCYTKVNLDLKPNTNYYLVLEVAERTGDINIRPCNNANQVSQFNSALRIDSPPVGIRPPQNIVSKSTFTDESIKYMLRTHAYCTSGKSGHIKFRIAVYETQKDVFIPYSKQSVGNLITDETSEYYNKYKIPILVNGNEAAVIYRDAPLADGESINYKNDNLPDITFEKGTNTITANTEVKPSSIKIKYLKI